MKIVAELISLFFTPALFFFLMPFAVMYRYTQDGAYAMKWFLFSAIFTTLGILLFFMGRLSGIFSDIDFTKRKERGVIYFIAWSIAVFYLAVAILFKGILYPISIASIGIVVGLVLFEVVTLKVKASIHVGAACAFVMSLGLLYGMQAFFAVLWIVPILAWSRIYLKHHTVQEVLLGGVLGSAIVIATFIIGRGLI